VQQRRLDTVHLLRIDADTGIGGNQAFSFIGASAFSGAAGELRYKQGASTTSVLGDVDGDGIADPKIVFDGVISVTAGDFVL
jgi:hypothetical protein